MNRLRTAALYLLYNVAIILTMLSMSTPTVCAESVSKDYLMTTYDQIMVHTEGQKELYSPSDRIMYEQKMFEDRQKYEEAKLKQFEDDVYLIALLMKCEAESEPEYGKRLVIDTVLNRFDRKGYPKTIKGVIYQPYQYTGIQPPRVNRVTVTEADKELVREEIVHRTNSDVLYFRSGHYHRFGTPLCHNGTHYYSTR